MSAVIEVVSLVERQKYNEALLLVGEIDLHRSTLSDLNELCVAFQKIPMDIRTKNSNHIVVSAYISKMLGDATAFEEWYKTLVYLRDETKGVGEKEGLERCISRVNLMRSKTSNAQTLILLSALTAEDGKRTKQLPCSATSKRPSVLRGTKDCSEWGKYYKAVKSILLPVFENLGDFDGKCAIELAIGELCMEKGDFTGAILSLGVAVTSDETEIKFGAYYALAKLYLLEGDIEKAKATIEDANKLIENSGAVWLLDNFKAVLADVAIYCGDNEYINEWIPVAKELVKDKVLPDTELISIIYAKALMARGEWRESTLYLQGLSDHFDNNARILDSIECKILCAISLMQLESDDKSVELLHSVLELAKTYGYTTVFADKGKLMFRLLGKYQKAYHPENGFGKFVDAISAQTKKISLLLASEYNNNNVAEVAEATPPILTDTEVRIIQMLNEGASNKSIGVDLDIKLTTVKFHVKNLFTKFDAQNRVELLNKARSFKMLS